MCIVQMWHTMASYFIWKVTNTIPVSFLWTFTMYTDITWSSIVLQLCGSSSVELFFFYQLWSVATNYMYWLIFYMFYIYNNWYVSNPFTIHVYIPAEYSTKFNVKARNIFPSLGFKWSIRFYSIHLYKWWSTSTHLSDVFRQHMKWVSHNICEYKTASVSQ